MDPTTHAAPSIVVVKRQIPLSLGLIRVSPEASDIVHDHGVDDWLVRGRSGLLKLRTIIRPPQRGVRPLSHRMVVFRLHIPLQNDQSERGRKR